MCNSVVVTWILNSLSSNLFAGAIYAKTASEMRNDLKETYDKVDGSAVFNLQKNDMVSLPPCTCDAAKHFDQHNQLIKLIQFLMGLDESYLAIRSNLLTREPLPSVKTAFSLISGEDHTVDICFEIVGYPAGYVKKNFNSNSRHVSSNNASTDLDFNGVSSNNATTEARGGTLWHQRLGHPADQVLNVLKTTLNLDSHSTSDHLCDTCNKAKQTREPFPIRGITFISLSEFILTAVYIINNGFEVDLHVRCVERVARAALEASVAEQRCGSYKARLVVKGFNQKEGINFDETFSPVVKMSTVRCVIALSVTNKWPLFQLDINNVFLYGDLDEDIYMTIPKGFASKDNKNKFIALLVYVDDIVIIGNCMDEIDKSDKDLCMSQRKYCLELLKEYGLLECKPVSRPMEPNSVLSYVPTKDDPLLNNITGYQKLLGKLIYISHTRPDIAYSVHCLAQYMHSPLKSHLNSSLNVLRYLKGAPGKGIRYIHTYCKNNLNGYSDAD
ncbi:ribonuclease H-like domain-containing protein [Tanacetum coccineum]